MKQKRIFWADRLGLGAIGIVSLGYVMFWSTFAKIRIQLPFLDFPIFIGEMLLAFCVALLICKWVRGQWSADRWQWAAAGYIGFIVVKTVMGYPKWGPLALRDAAFFYYPAFIVFGYAFFDPAAYGRLARRLVLAVLLVVMLLGQFILSASFSLFAIAILLALSEENMTERVLLTAAVFLLAPYAKMVVFFQRADLISYFIPSVFLVVSLVFYSRWNRLVKIGLVVFGFVFVMAILGSANRLGIWKTISPQTIIHDARPAVAPWPDDRPRARVLFNIDGSDPQYYPDNIKEFFGRFGVQLPCSAQKAMGTSVQNYAVTAGSPNAALKAPPAAGAQPASAAVVLEAKEGNALFRYYIWQDMIKEYWQRKPLFGFAFGRPLRSPTIIFYGFSSPEAQDGWVGAHNSFLYMLYRGGIVGLAMVIAVIVFWAGMVRDFGVLKDLGGLFLCAALLSWIVNANFFLIFELPYTAIPVWALWGITARYRDFLKGPAK